LLSSCLGILGGWSGVASGLLGCFGWLLWCC